MNGIELSENFFFEYGMPLLKADFPELLPRVAAGIVGSGSECLGFDDEISRDHDYEAGFCLWLSREDVAVYGFRLIRAYNALPKEYRGVRKQAASAYGSSKFGVFVAEDFFERLTGLSAAPAPEDTDAWLYTPEQALAAATGGKVFYDGSGGVTALRAALASPPEDVRLKKIAARLALMAQSGQYNFARCLAHGERAAARLALAEFVNHALYALHALARRYTPYYKWRFRSARGLGEPYRGVTLKLERLLTDETTDEEKRAAVEEIARDFVEILRGQDLAEAHGDYLEPYAFGVAGRIRSQSLRARHIMDCGE
ncbi:MAG: DUF4037 domain-containing protein [Eubacteriales bacterium]|nr:DUF4037 domain-containing protein [Eubacteriales bacterium]